MLPFLTTATLFLQIGPRMDLELVRIEQGVCDGMVLYHKHVVKSLEEVAEIQRRREKRVLLKAMRKKKQVGIK